MDYRVDDKQLDASAFLVFVDQIWPGSYDLERTRSALSNTPTMLYFGAQPGAEGFYEKNGCSKGMQSYTIDKKRK